VTPILVAPLLRHWPRRQV